MKKITYIQFAIYFAVGLFTPAWYRVLLGRGGSLETFGLLFGLMALGSIASTYFVGWACERRTPLKVLSWTLVLQALVMLAYLAPNAPLYFLQTLYGALGASLATLQQILIAQYSEEFRKLEFKVAYNHSYTFQSDLYESLKQKLGTENVVTSF